MNYTTYTIDVKELISLIENGKMDLKPSYQRNEVWTKKDQESLIDSVISNFPLPNFFFYKNGEDIVEMVDGQQRARAIYSFYKGLIGDSQKRKINDINQDSFLAYKINITEITNVHNEEEIRKFYVLVNKKGMQLNTPEIFKAEFASTKFLSLVETLLENQNFSNLELFTDATSKRMNDRSYVEELVAYLLLGITDKKTAVEKIYQTDISEEQYNFVTKVFGNIINHFTQLDEIKKINETRYKQRNDFYTFFNFVNTGLNVDEVSILIYQYRILLVLDEYISPSIDNCESIKNYATNCITQSNSKKSRIERLSFFEKILRNREKEEDFIFKDVYNFLNDLNRINALKKVSDYLLYDLDNG